MSNRRTGCSFHQKWLNIDVTLHDQSLHSKHAIAVISTYNKYCSATPNHVYSNRLGTSYNTQIILINKQWAFSHDVPFVYQKKYFNYHTTSSSPSCTYSTRTLKRQLSRHNQLFRRLFNQESFPHNFIHIPELVTSVGRKYHYVLDPQHSSYHFIKHIKFKKFFQKPSKLFPLPRAWSRYTHIPGFNSTTKLDSRPEMKMVLQDPSPDLPVTKVITHISDLLINDTVNPQALDTPSPLMSHNAQKKLAYLERKCLKEAEALQCRKAFYLHIKTTNHSYNYHSPPLFSMLNASVGHTQRKDFVEEISDEAYQLYRITTNHDTAGYTNYLYDLTNVLSEWQTIIHAIRTNTPIPRKDAKKLKRWNKVYNPKNPSLKALTRRFKELTHDLQKSPMNRYEVFRAYSTKRPSISLDFQALKRPKLLME
ncbi:hypothetical protein C1645_738273 [Glomus cerebriforme]|uniref:DUF8211 domain-containing protein n=1 Tax=Glomus cerebriforme TaxID=658196 RepID=A0A397SUT9_9GLOM|nr:hypothetical protein C1645_738273 [Glomus cerebriforme]